MKKYFIVLLSILCWQVSWAVEKYNLEDFAIQLGQITSEPSHVWVSSGYSTVNPKYPTVTGVNDFFSPPFAARKFGLRADLLVADSISIPDAGSYGKGDVGLLYGGGVWYPHKIVRYGTYHHLKGEYLVSLALTSELIPLVGEAGFIEKIIIRNRSAENINVKVVPKVTPGTPDFVPLNKWEFSPPESSKEVARNISSNVWSNGTVKIKLYTENELLTLAPGETKVVSMIVIAKKEGEIFSATVDIEQLEKKATIAWEKRIARYTQNIPVLHSKIEGLEDYYKRALVSGLVCIWENPSYVLNPFFTTSGIDGGGMCTYLWDNAGYAPNTSVMMFGNHMVDIARQMVNIDLEKCYAYSLDGTGIGVKYSFSPVAFTSLVSAIFKFISPDAELFEYNKKFILNEEKRKGDDWLIDYGFQHNLLEMRGTGWEHVTVSPNADRSWCLKQLAQMGVLVNENQRDREDWNKQADAIIASIRKNLWDSDKQWFACLYPNGYRDYVHSIQVFDALRFGVCTPDMEKVVVSELTDGAYLGKYGVSSISKSDSVHYEVVDIDWSGGGAYTGDGPQVALTMYEKGYPEIGWKVLKRLFWMGNSLLYYPQEHYIDRPMSPAHKRANNAVGLCGIETVLFGVLGIQPSYDGSLYVNPQLCEGDIHIDDFVFRNNHFDMEVSTTYLKIRRNGKVIYEGTPKQVQIL